MRQRQKMLPTSILSHQNMPAITRDMELGRAIRSQIRELVSAEELELTPMLPVNNVPHPTALSRSSDYSPCPPM